MFLHQIKDSVDVPVVANGDIKNEDDVAKVKQMTGVDGEWKIDLDLAEILKFEF